VGIGHRTGLVQAIKFDVEDAAIAAGGHSNLQGIKAIDRGVDRVFEPFAPRGPTDVISTAGISRALNVHGRGPVFSSIVRRVRVVISYSFAAAIEVLRLYGPGHGLGQTAKRRFYIDNFDRAGVGS